MLQITVEVNPPKQGQGKRCQGVFLLGSDGHRYLAHQGGVGGGRPGIWKQGLREHYSSAEWVEVNWPKGSRTSAILIGAIASDDFVRKVGAFVRAAADFKLFFYPDASR